MKPISVAIITKNRSKDLDECLASLARQTVPVAELIVVDSSTDGQTKTLINAFRKVFRRIKYIYEPKGGFPIARNGALSAATHQWIVFTDDDCITHPRWLEMVVKAARRHPDCAAIAGLSKTLYPSNIIACAAEVNELYWKTKARQGNRIIDLETLDNKNVAYNLRFLKKHTISYDESRVQEYLGANDDCDLGMQIQYKGGTAFYESLMMVFHKDHTSFLPYCKWKIAAALAHASYDRKWKNYRKTFDTPHMDKITFVFRYARLRRLSRKQLYALLFILGITLVLIRLAKTIYHLYGNKRAILLQ